MRVNLETAGAPLLSDPDFAAIVKAIDELPLDAIKRNEAFYPRVEVDRQRLAAYIALRREGTEFPPIIVYADGDGYIEIDGEHRRLAHKDCGDKTIRAVIVELKGDSPLALAAFVQDRGGSLREADARQTARRLYEADKKISSTQLAKVVHRSRQAVDDYVKDLRASYEMAQDIAILKMDRLGIPQERIGRVLGIPRTTLEEHLTKMPELAKSSNAKLARGLPPDKVAQQEGWPEPLVWALRLQEMGGQERFKELKWSLRAWDNWYFTDCDPRFGDDWPGRIPAQLVAHALYFFSRAGDLVFDPMAGGGVVPDTCLAFGRRCWAFDMVRREARPEIEQFTWPSDGLTWPVNGKSKPDLIFFDPPYFTKKQKEYAEVARNAPGSPISDLSREGYLQWLAEFCQVARENAKPTTRFALLNAGWRDFQGKAALEEEASHSITPGDYERIMIDGGWVVTHWVDCPLSSERFNAGVHAAMQAKAELGTTFRVLLVAQRRP